MPKIREEARSKILHDSMLYFAKNGFTGTKISDLAKHIGIGQSFVRELAKEKLDELWVIGRNQEQLLALKKEYGEKIVPISKDLTEDADIVSLSDLLKEQAISILWLVNNAGIAKMVPSAEFSISEINQTIDLNCKAPAKLINICLPFMEKGAKILNISSASAFQPVPYLNLYAATKAFERSYSRALNAELGASGITAPEKVVKKALKDAKKGKDMSVCSLYVERKYDTGFL